MESLIYIILGIISLIYIISQTDNSTQEYMYYFTKENIHLNRDLMEFGTHNGYVCIPKSSKLYGRSYYDMNYNEDGNKIQIDNIQEQLENINVHGGLTYSGDIRGNNTFVFGFDTCHYSDNKENQNEKYVEDQCRLLMEQLKKIK